MKNNAWSCRFFSGIRVKQQSAWVSYLHHYEQQQLIKCCTSKWLARAPLGAVSLLSESVDIYCNCIVNTFTITFIYQYQPQKLHGSGSKCWKLLLVKCHFLVTPLSEDVEAENVSTIQYRQKSCTNKLLFCSSFRKCKCHHVNFELYFIAEIICESGDCILRQTWMEKSKF